MLRFLLHCHLVSCYVSSLPCFFYDELYSLKVDIIKNKE